MNYILLSIYDLIWDLIVSKVPSHTLRYFYIKLLNPSIKRSSSILMHVRFKGLRTITFNSNQVVNQGVTLDGRGGLYIGENVDIAERVVIWSMSHDPYNKQHITIKSKTTISDYAWIGADSTILAGIYIGEGAVVGAGSVVTKNVNALDIVAGNPAKVIGKRDRLPEYKFLYKPLCK
jgi:maltose O-acetyltransferase